jgi:Uma2 family endonuclease
VTHQGLIDREAVLRAAVNDTEESPWMTMPEYQLVIVNVIMSILKQHARLQGLGWHLFSALIVVKRRGPGDDTLEASPDLFKVDTDETLRRSWRIDVEGKAPQFVLEVVTEESKHRDFVEKPGIYDVMGVEEYAIFAPLRGEGASALSFTAEQPRDYLFPGVSMDAGC